MKNRLKALVYVKFSLFLSSKTFIYANCLMVPENNCLLGNGSEGYSYKAFDERGGERCRRLTGKN